MALNKKSRRFNHNPGLLSGHTHFTTRNRWARLNKGARTKDVFFEDEME